MSESIPAPAPASVRPRLQVVVASTRPGRQGAAVGAWMQGVARAHGGFEVELVDLAAVGLPLFDEPRHPRLRQYEHAHTRAWSAVVGRADAFVFVTPEYNHGPPPSLLNALDFLVHEWAYKPAGFVSYGGVSAGLRGVQATKGVASALKMVPLPEGVAIPFFTRFVDGETGEFRPGEVQAQAAAVMLDEMLRWAGALRTLRG
jgi:NAD(P)H-dependent FMN reductase